MPHLDGAEIVPSSAYCHPANELTLKSWLRICAPGGGGLLLSYTVSVSSRLELAAPSDTVTRSVTVCVPITSAGEYHGFGLVALLSIPPPLTTAHCVRQRAGTVRVRRRHRQLALCISHIVDGVALTAVICGAAFGGGGVRIVDLQRHVARDRRGTIRYLHAHHDPLAARHVRRRVDRAGVRRLAQRAPATDHRPLVAQRLRPGLGSTADTDNWLVCVSSISPASR